MSYCRFGEGDVYVYWCEIDWLTCAMCRLRGGNPFDCKTLPEMLAHVEEHVRAGHRVGDAVAGLREDIDALGDA